MTVRDTSVVVREAVIFFEQGRIGKEMLQAEFEAVLDGVLNLPEYAGQTLRAAWVGLDGRLAIRECVLFVISFDRQGRADRRWNVPLRHLASQAGDGPDLGAGPIRLACRSQCPVSWHAESLWDADRSHGIHPLKLLRDAIRNNRLGLRPDEPTPGEAGVAASQGVEQQLALLGEGQRTAIATLLREQTLRIRMLQREAGQQQALLNERHERELAEGEALRQRLQTECDALRSANESLATQNAALRQHLASETRRFETEFQGVQEQVRDLKEQWRVESEQWLTQRVEEETRTLRQAIELRDLELRHHYATAREMREELYRLRQAHAAIPGEDSDWLDDRAPGGNFRH